MKAAIARRAASGGPKVLPKERREGAILEGERNTVLHSLAWDHLAQGLSPDLVLADLHAHNQARCQPPLGDGEVIEIWRSACKGFLAKATEGRHEAAEAEMVTIATLPEKAWRGLFADYRLLVGPTTEAPEEYHFWLFALGLGATLGRRLYVYHAVRLYPNFYLCLVGPTGVSRKDTAWSRIKDLLDDLHAPEPGATPRFEILPGVGSAEGLLETLRGEDMVVVLREAELLSLLSKARQEALGNLIPQLTALYDSPNRHTLRTRRNAIECIRPFLSIVAGTTKTWLRQALTEREIFGGFANRWVYTPGTHRPPLAYPPPLDATRRDTLLKEINKVRGWADAYTKGEAKGQLEVSQLARDLFTAWYGNYYERAKGEGLLPALAVVGHLEKSNQATFADFTSSGRGLEDAILEMLRAAPTRTLSKRTLYRKLHTPARALDQAGGGLLRLGLVKEVRVNVDGSKAKVAAYALQ